MLYLYIYIYIYCIHTYLQIRINKWINMYIYIYIYYIQISIYIYIHRLDVPALKCLDPLSKRVKKKQFGHWNEGILDQPVDDPIPVSIDGHQSSNKSFHIPIASFDDIDMSLFIQAKIWFSNMGKPTLHG